MTKPYVRFIFEDDEEKAKQQLTEEIKQVFNNIKIKPPLRTIDIS